jgi:hypothetical protein
VEAGVAVVYGCGLTNSKGAQHHSRCVAHVDCLGELFGDPGVEEIVASFNGNVVQEGE